VLYAILVLAFSAWEADLARCLVSRAVVALTWCATLAALLLSGRGPERSLAGFRPLTHLAIDSFASPPNAVERASIEVMAHIWVLFVTLFAPAAVLTVVLIATASEPTTLLKAVGLFVGVSLYSVGWAAFFGALSWAVRNLVPRRGAWLLLALLVAPSCTEGVIDLPDVPSHFRYFLDASATLSLGVGP
jgi:hypothetical protein